MTECEIFLSLLVKFLDSEKPNWQRCLALEVLHKLSVQPDLLRWEREREITLLSLLYYYYYHVIIDSLIFVFFRSFTQSYDMKLHSTKIFRDIVNGVGTYIQSQFMNPSLSTTTTSEEFQWYCIFQNKCTVPSCRSSYLMTIVQHYCSHITYTT